MKTLVKESLNGSIKESSLRNIYENIEDMENDVPIEDDEIEEEIPVEDDEIEEEPFDYFSKNDDKTIDDIEDDDVDEDPDKYEDVELDDDDNYGDDTILALKNALSAPEYSRPEFVFKARGIEDIFSGVPMALVGGNGILFKLFGGGMKKFNISDIQLLDLDNDNTEEDI